MKLIDKSALVAEIERRIKEYQSTGDDYWFPVIENLKSILSFLDTLEMKDFWKSANGDDLPEVDREVIVLIEYNAQRNIHDDEYPTYRVGFGHRPNPNGWDGKNIETNEVTHYTPKLYDKGGWSAPNIVYWLDARLPYEENKIDKEIEQ